MCKKYLPKLKFKNCVLVALGNLILAFGLYEIHAQTQVSEGGVLGLMLLLKHWLNISPAYSGFIMDVICFFIGFRVLGKEFLGYSAVAFVSFSVFYRILECFPPLWPNLYAYPLAAAVLGALFVGVGVGICVRAGGASGGDDALAMAFTHRMGIGIQWFYLLDDVVILLLSLTYIPFIRIFYSLITVILSGQIIGWVQKIPMKSDLR